MCTEQEVAAAPASSPASTSQHGWLALFDREYADVLSRWELEMLLIVAYV
jgi:hypothetical protein